MLKRIPIVLLLLGLTISWFADTADGWPFRRRRSYTSYASTGLIGIAPKTDSVSANLTELDVYYSYDRAMGDEVAYPDRLRVFLVIGDEQVLSETEPIVAEVRLTDLSDSQNPVTCYCPVELQGELNDGYHLATFDVTNDGHETPVVKPAKVYRLFVNLHREASQYGEQSAIGAVPTPYYVATSGSTRIDQARQRIAMRTFREFYYTEHGWMTDESYPMDCHAFYCWAIGPCTKGSGDWGDPGYLFGNLTEYHDSSEIPDVASDAAIHGDYVRVPGHTFMLLAYDSSEDFVWTMEGNFNSTIEVAQRRITSGWTVGHLTNKHIPARVFASAPASVD